MKINILHIVKFFCFALVWNIFLFTSIFSVNNAFATSRNKLENTIIVDTEISNFLDEVVATVSDKTDLKLYVIVNNRFNAMATSKNVIGLYTGLFNRIDDVEILVAIITHEIGHITENHLTRLQKRIDDSQMQNIIGSIMTIGALVAAASASSNSDGMILPSIAPYLIGDITTKNLISYTRSEESLADQFLINTFLQKNISLKEYVDFMSEMAKEDDVLYSSQNAWRYDHPKTSDRVDDIKSRLQSLNTDEKKLKRLSTELSVKYKMTQAKIFGLLNSPENITAKYSAKNDTNTPYYFYALAVSNWFNKNYEESLSNFDIIINDYLPKPEYSKYINKGYILEGKAETYLSKGDINKAINSYESAIKELARLPDDKNKNFNAVKQSFAGALIKSDNKENISRGIEILRNLIFKKESATTYHQMGVAYGKLGDIGRAHYYLAKYFSSIGNKKEMQNNIEKSEKVLDKNSKEYSDLIIMKTAN